VPANGGSTTFQLVFQPTANTGLQSATVTIANDDPNKNPYTFMVQGTAVTQPRVDPSLDYNGAESLNGDQNPTVSKGTDFGSAAVGSQSATHSFRFYNYGTIDMTLTGSMVQLSGANSGDFAIVSMPFSPIAPNQYSTIGIRFQPTGSGLRTASLLIYFDATYGLGATSPYTVALNGTGVQNTVSVTVQPNPLSGPSFTVDGALYYGSIPFNWNAGDSHTISTTTPQNIGYPVTTMRFVWSSWSDGGAISHIVAPTIGTTYTANFTTQYFLSMAASAGGTLSPSSDWTNSGTVVQISATPNNGYSFAGWTGSGSGSYSGNNNPASVTMNATITETASFTPNPETGSLQVIISPAGAVSAGAQWQVDGGAWQSSGTTLSSVSVGSHTVAFNTVSGWTTPADQTVSVSANQTATATGNYVAIVSLPPQLTGIAMNTNGMFLFDLNGTGGSNYVVQVSSNLVNWVNLITNVIPAGGVRVFDFPMQTNQPQMFYRALPLSQGPLILQPGPVDSQDIWTTSTYSYANCSGSYPGGGQNDYRLRIGGWSDLYYTLIQFNLTGLPTNAASAVLYLYCENLSGGGTPLYLDRITSAWDWQTSGTGCDRLRLWWADKPSTVQWAGSQLPTPTLSQWYAVDITTLYNAWQNGTYSNYGLQFRPVLNSNNNFDEFYSADYLGDPTLRPMLVITPAN
jgi:hypothetical protein